MVMERTEEYNFRKDVYTTLIKFTNYRVAGLLSRERKAYKNDSVFFSELLISSGDQLQGIQDWENDWLIY